MVVLIWVVVALLAGMGFVNLMLALAASVPGGDSFLYSVWAVKAIVSGAGALVIAWFLGREREWGREVSLLNRAVEDLTLRVRLHEARLMDVHDVCETCGADNGLLSTYLPQYCGLVGEHRGLTTGGCCACGSPGWVAIPGFATVPPPPPLLPTSN